MVSGSLALFGRLVLLHCLTMTMTDAFKRGDYADAEVSGSRVIEKQQQNG